ncbi:alpha/beta hydrolase [Actinomadura rupiterrae]|uniref:alpha/beta hydrolase n=1 Tax=Actinomadura rupiterrae TaxID=559627 RepID=UPI0020A4C942|nr:alpha/beta hydrolase-fold protein [Actinomadura rupiterrae]MCP2343021.1 enterochelin esterase-like enzyme [Actinomadura rupiterrae]
MTSRRRARGIGAAFAAAALVVSTAAGCGSGGAKAQPPAQTTTPAPAAPAGRTEPPVQMPSGPKAHFKVSHTTSGGPIMVTTLKGAKSGVTGKVWVWLPPEYKDPRYAKSGFPVLMLYTGNTGVNYNFWAHEEVEPIQKTAVQMEKKHKAHPFIMVMPVLQMSTRQDTECSDIPGMPKMGTFLGQDVYDMVKANFRTLPGRNGWGLGGASSGAFCAVKLALQHPDKYRAAMSWAGYFVPEPQAGPRWTPQQMRANSPDEMVKKRPDVRLFLLAGDRKLFRADRERVMAFKQLVQAPTTAQVQIQKNGGHYTADLQKLLPDILAWFTRNLEGPVPGS